MPMQPTGTSMAVSLPLSDFASSAATASPLAFVDTVFCWQEAGLSATRLPKCTESMTLDFTTAT